jgi:NAD(P)-dependent dehydrogenase (short-subunit alcohol dehydrogenase family)
MVLTDTGAARRDDPFDLSGKAALVTGGARGLGFAMARALGRRGASVMLFDVSATEAEAAADRLHADHIEALGIAGDVTNHADSERAVARVVDAWGALDICVNNAGVSGNMAAVDVTPAEWRRIVDVNLMGVFFVAQAAGRRMIVQKSGSIVNIASMSGLIVNVPQLQSVYNISKAGVIMATKSLASEWAEYGIRVNAIAPGYMRTEMTARSFDAADDWSQQWLAATPMGRPGEPEELGGAVVYLASSASSFTTGAVLVIDGGYVVR